MKKIVLFLLTWAYAVSSLACTSFIISGKATPSGRPMMFKHRDTGELNNRIARYQGEKYAFMGLVNSPVLDGEVWAGMNEAGLCIMNTASYNLREDSLDCQMDREGELMYHVLGNCKNIHEFEQWLASYPKPWGVEANFGIIDAEGGAAYYEMNNDRWIKYDVNEEKDGYRVVTNFSFAGRYDDYEGWERYLTASAIMKENFSMEKEMTAVDAINLFSRQYRHELLGLNYTPINAPEYTVDQDFIPRRITSAVVVFNGVKAQGNANQTVMWSLLGYPACAVAIPLMMKLPIPAYMQAYDTKATEGKGLHSEMCDVSLQIKNKWVFLLKISNGSRYLSTQNLFRGAEGKPALMTCTQNVENQIVQDFAHWYHLWCTSPNDLTDLYNSYEKQSKAWIETYYSAFTSYLVH